MTKLGMKRTIKQPPKPRPTSLKRIRQVVRFAPPNRTPLKPVSAKQAKRLAELNNLKWALMATCGNKSEFSGDSPDWQSHWDIEPHHIMGRIGKHLLNPFEIIMVTRPEHTEMEKHKTPENRAFLLGIVKPLRIAQGFKEEDYK